MTFHFYVAYEWTKYTVVLHYTLVERLGRDKYSSILGPIVSYEENELLSISTLRSYL